MSGLLVKSLPQPEWLQLTRLFDEAIWRMLKAIFFPQAIVFDCVERVRCIISSVVYNPKYAIKDQEITRSLLSRSGPGLPTQLRMVGRAQSEKQRWERITA
jgi:hypothetical protein